MRLPSLDNPTRDDGTPTTVVVVGMRLEPDGEPGRYRVYFEAAHVNADPGDEDHTLVGGYVDAQTRGAMKRQRRARRLRERAAP